MVGVSKAISDDLCLKAKESLERLGKVGRISRKLQAIITAKKFDISMTSEIFETSRQSLMTWIKNFEKESERGLALKAGRGRKPITNAKIKDFAIKFIQKNPNTTNAQLRRIIQQEHNVSMSETTANRLLKQLGFSYITPRPIHPKANVLAQQEFKKNLAEIRKNNPHKRLFFFDEARFGTHLKIGHGWFQKGIRTTVKIKLGFENFYVYSAV
jgi:transposase